MKIAEALKQHLHDNLNAFTSIEYGSGGCDTCGYGAPEYEVLDMAALDKEIDLFCASFEEKKEPE